MVDAPALVASQPWKVLFVDDDEDVLAISRIGLGTFQFDGRRLEIFCANSAAAARDIVIQHPDIAVSFIDVVMETDDAGLELVQFIREALKNIKMRLIIRTGQPGMAPEQYVIDHYDIDDYKEKSELTTDRLRTSLRLALKAHRDLTHIDAGRQGMAQIVGITPELYQYQHTDMEGFYRTVLEKAAQLSLIIGRESVQGMIFTRSNNLETVVAASNYFNGGSAGWSRRLELTESLLASKRIEWQPVLYSATELLLPFRRVGAYHCNYLYLLHTENSSISNHHLLRLLLQQGEAALKNIELYQRLHSVNRHAIRMLAIASEYKDEDTGEHLMRIRDRSYALAIACGLDETESVQIADASILHDVGKLGIPDEILQKPGKLTDHEFQIIKGHTVIGGKILSRDQWFSLAREIAENHHERWDGKGYPRGLAGEKIPFHARIVAVVDVFDALTNVRPYKAAWPVDLAIEEITNGAGTQFDPDVVARFLELYRDGGLDLSIAEE